MKKCKKWKVYLRRPDGICVMRLSRKIREAHLVTFSLNLSHVKMAKINRKVILKLIDKVTSSYNFRDGKSDQIAWRNDDSIENGRVHLHDAKSCNCWNSVGDNLSHRGGAAAIFTVFFFMLWNQYNTKIDEN